MSLDSCTPRHPTYTTCVAVACLPLAYTLHMLMHIHASYGSGPAHATECSTAVSGSGQTHAGVCSTDTLRPAQGSTSQMLPPPAGMSPLQMLADGGDVSPACSDGHCLDVSVGLSPQHNMTTTPAFFFFNRPAYKNDMQDRTSERQPTRYTPPHCRSPVV